MKALLLAVVLLCAPVAVLAGDIPIPPAPPNCTENCRQASSSPMPLKTQILLALLGIIS